MKTDKAYFFTLENKDLLFLLSNKQIMLFRLLKKREKMHIHIESNHLKQTIHTSFFFHNYFTDNVREKLESIISEIRRASKKYK